MLYTKVSELEILVKTKQEQEAVAERKATVAEKREADSERRVAAAEKREHALEEELNAVKVIVSGVDVDADSTSTVEEPNETNVALAAQQDAIGL